MGCCMSFTLQFPALLHHIVHPRWLAWNLAVELRQPRLTLLQLDCNFDQHISHQILNQVEFIHSIYIHTSTNTSISSPGCQPTPPNSTSKSCANSCKSTTTKCSALNHSIVGWIAQSIPPNARSSLASFASLVVLTLMLITYKLPRNLWYPATWESPRSLGRTSSSTLDRVSRIGYEWS